MGQEIRLWRYGYGITNYEKNIGYVIHPDYQGRGYATEVVGVILSELREMGFHKVTAGYFAENAASYRVMEKCGMQRTDVTEEEEILVKSYYFVKQKCYNKS